METELKEIRVINKSKVKNINHTVDHMLLDLESLQQLLCDAALHPEHHAIGAMTHL